MTSESTHLGLKICKRITRHHAKTFYFASQCLPRKVRSHAYAVYGFCRWADDGVDCAQDDHDAARRLLYAREVLDAAYETGAVPDGLLAFRHTVKTRGIPKPLFEALLDGMEMDLTVTRYADFAALDRYCYRVAGVVGLMMTHVFGFRNERCLPRAEALGTAMQLTNILRDIREDHERGRIYLPLDEMKRFGVTETHLAEGIVDEPFRAFLRFQIDRASAFYEEARAGIHDLNGESSRLTVRVMGRVYGGILQEIERLNGEVFQTRAHVPTIRKLTMLGSCQAANWRESAKRFWS